MALVGFSQTAQAATPRCTTNDLKATVHLDQGSAGHVEGSIVLRNTSKQTCSVRGYPGVSFVDGDGHEIGPSAKRSGAGSVRTITLKPNKYAKAPLRVANVANYDKDACEPVPANGFRVYPPDETKALYAPHKIKTCSTGIERTATIGPLK